MERLWAPWRVEFIEKVDRSVCIFCEKPKESDERARIVLRGRVCYALLNAFPYNAGHVMVAPYRHVVYPWELTREEVEEMYAMTVRLLKVLQRVYNPDGFNIGINIGRDAGAGYDHLHVHIVPRWRGDTNFMPVLAEVRVISEHLDYSYRRIREALATEEAR